MRKILLMVVGAILLVVIAVVSTLAFVRASDPAAQSTTPTPVAEEVEEEVDEDIEEEAEEEVDEEADEEVDEEDEADAAEEDEEVDAGEEEQEFNPKDAIYHEFHPSFVVNINDSDANRSRFLAIDITAVGYNQTRIDALRAHMPAIRNDLIILFSTYDAATLRTQEGKETLRQEALQSIRNVMQKKTGDVSVQEVYFNKFVIQ